MLLPYAILLSPACRDTLSPYLYKLPLAFACIAEFLILMAYIQVKLYHHPHCIRPSNYILSAGRWLLNFAGKEIYEKRFDRIKARPIGCGFLVQQRI